jgi:hypothetical protein
VGTCRELSSEILRGGIECCGNPAMRSLLYPGGQHYLRTMVAALINSRPGQSSHTYCTHCALRVGYVLKFTLSILHGGTGSMRTVYRIPSWVRLHPDDFLASLSGEQLNSKRTALAALSLRDRESQRVSSRAYCGTFHPRVVPTSLASIEPSSNGCPHCS